MALKKRCFLLLLSLVLNEVYAGDPPVISLNIREFYPEECSIPNVINFFDRVNIEIRKKVSYGEYVSLKFDIPVVDFCVGSKKINIITFFKIYNEYFKPWIPKSIIDNIPEGGSIFAYYYFKKDIELLKLFIKEYPPIVNIGDITIDTHIMPLAYTVKANDLDMTEYLLENGADINTGEIESNAGNGSGDVIRDSLLDIASTPEMKALLKKYNINEYIIFAEGPKYILCNDDRVRIRAHPNTDSAIIGIINKGETIVATGMNPEYVTIEGKMNRWVKVYYNNKFGWIFGHYLDIMYR